MTPISASAGSPGYSHWGKPPGLSRDVGSHGGPSFFLTITATHRTAFQQKLDASDSGETFILPNEPSVLLQTHACVKQPRAQARRRQRRTGLTSHKPLPREPRRSICFCEVVRGLAGPAAPPLWAPPLLMMCLPFSLEHHVTGTHGERPFLITI